MRPRLPGSGAAAAKFRENIEDRNRQSLIFGVLPLSFFCVLAKLFSRRLVISAKKRTALFRPQKNFPPSSMPFCRFSVAKTQQPTPIFSFYRGTPHKLSEKILEFC